MSPRLPNAAEPAVVIAVATYNGRHLLETFLPSVAAQTFRDARVVVVDDASTDDTVPWLACEWPEAQVVVQPRNSGVTVAFNACVAAAGDAPFVALFNNDMELDPRCLEALVAALRRHPEAGSAAAKLVNFHDRSLLDGAGDVLDWAGTGWRRGHGEPDLGQYDAPGPVFGACAGAALYRGEALRRVGGFDERFFAFCEDVDWSLRAQLAGLDCRYVPEAVAYHMGSATLGAGMTDFTRYQLTRNVVWVVAKNYPFASLLRHAPRILYVSAAVAAQSALDRQLGVWARAWRDALRGMPGILRSRRAIQASRTISADELDRIVAATPAPRRRRGSHGRLRRRSDAGRVLVGPATQAQRQTQADAAVDRLGRREG